ncbi:MAG: DoxX family protein [Rhodobacterales bacterium]|nr:DoxX family protein [Rhodobacterales bacterium]
MLLSLAFAAAGVAKLMGVRMIFDVFDAISVGQWVRCLTVIIEVGSAIMRWVPGLQAIAGALFVCTMIGASIAQLTVLPKPFVPALVLGVLSAITLWANRGQLFGNRAQLSVR